MPENLREGLGKNEAVPSMAELIVAGDKELRVLQGVLQLYD